MSGHSHWSKIKRAKGANDARRGRIWSKLARRIIVVAKAGGGNPDENLHLRYAIDDAKAANMPNDTINNAIKKGTGELGSANYEEVAYEGYGAKGVAVLCECLTDNRNRTAPELRKIFEGGGGQLGNTGCVAWLFDSKGSFAIEADKTDEDTLMEIALEAGADDVILDDDTFEITCVPVAFSGLKKALADAEIPTVSATLAKVPQNTIEIADVDQARKVLRLMDNLDGHDDVQNVYANFDIAEGIMAEVGG